MFTQPCFIRKNTSELRKKLKELGYKCNNGKWMGAYLATFKRDNEHDLFYCGTPEYDLQNNPSLNHSIYCGTNEDLFLAIAALRDDSDKNQWFASNYFDVNMKPDRFVICTINDYKEFFGDCPYTKNYDDYHKATVEELIEHFKDK